MSHSVIKKKIADFYKITNELKECYRRMEVLHLLDNETKEINAETTRINK